MTRVIGWAAVIVGYILLSTLLNAVAIANLWGWFLTPAYGIPVPPIGTIIGLSMLVSWFTARTDDSSAKSTDKTFAVVLLEGFAKFLARFCIYMLMGFVVARIIGTA